MTSPHRLVMFTRRSPGRRGRGLSALSRRRLLAAIGVAGLLGVLLGVVPVAPAAAAGQPAVSVSVTDASGNPISSVVPTLFGGEYQVRVSYTCTGDQECTNMKVAIAAPPVDPYYGTHRKEVRSDWIPPTSPAPPITGNLASGYTVDLGTRPPGDTGVITFRYFLQERRIAGCCGGNPIGWGNFFPPGFEIAPEVTVTADNAATVTKNDVLATYESVIPDPTVSAAAQTAVKTDVEMPVTVTAHSECYNMSYAYGNVQAHYHELCGDTASVAVKLPAKAVWVEGSGGSYDAGSHTVTVTTGPDAWRGLVNGTFKVRFPSANYPTSGAGCFVDERFEASGSVTYLNGVTKAASPATVSRVTTVDNCVPFMKGTFMKSGSGNRYQVPNAGPTTGLFWYVDTFHQGNKPGIVTVTDEALNQPGMPVTKLTTEVDATFRYTLDNGVTGEATGRAFSAPAGRRIDEATVISSLLPGPNLDPSGTASTRFRVFYEFALQPGAEPGNRINTASATISYPDHPDVEPYQPTGSPDTHTIELYTVEPFARATVTKTANADSYDIRPVAYGGPHWIVDTCNRSNVQGVATVTDDALDQPGLRVTQINTNLAAAITYTLDDGTTTTVTGTTYSAPAGRRIVGATVTSPPLAGPNASPTGNGCTLFRVVYYFQVLPDAEEGDRTNNATVTMAYPNTDLGTIAATGSPARKTISLHHPPYTVTANPVTFSNTTNPGFAPRAGDEVLWKASGRFCALPTDQAMTPQYVFFAPKGWNVLADGASLAGSPAATIETTTVTYNGVAYNAVLAQLASPVPGLGVQAGDCYAMPELSVKTTPTLEAQAGTQTAYAFVGDAANAPAESYVPTAVAEATTGSDIDTDATTTDTFALRTGTADLQGVPRLLPVKEICQPDPSEGDGCNWLSDPAVTVGVPPTATSIKYRVTIRNTGQTDLSNVVVYDVLPYPGDTGTSDTTATTPRGSTVKEALSTLTVDRPAGMTMAYSASTNPPRPEVYSGAVSGDWTAPMGGASAIRATIPSLAAGTSRTFTYEAALVGAAADQTACNSIAVSASTLVASEPPRVCATTQEADFSIESTDRLPLQTGRVGVVPFVVNNGGGSQSATGGVTISVPAEVDVVDLTPEGWRCSAPSTSGPVEVACTPVNQDGTTRSLAKDVPETIALEVRPTDEAPAELCFDAAVEGLMNDPNTENDTARSCSTALAAKPELNVSKDDGRASVAVGEELTYTITASNWLVGEPVDGVVLTDTLPDSLEFVSANPVPTSQSGQTLTWELGRLGQAALPGNGTDPGTGSPDASKSVTVTARVRPGTQDSLTNVAEATGADPADSSITLTASGRDVDAVTNVFTDKGAEVSTPQNAPVTTPLDEIAGTAGAPLDPALVTQADAPAHGSLTIDATSGAVTYLPERGFTGDDSYRVQVCDTTAPTPQCFVASVVVHVGVNVVDAGDDVATTTAGNPVTTDVRVNDLTQSGQPLAVPTITEEPAQGSATVNDDGTVTYTPDPRTSGRDVYRYRVCDTSHPTPVCAVASVAVQVRNVWNETGETVRTPQNTPVTTQLDQIVTTEGAPVDVSSVSQDMPPFRGTIAIDPATGAVTYNPNPGYTGADAFMLRMCDEGASECSTVTVYVQVAANVVTAADDTASTVTGQPVTTDVRDNDTSASAQPFAAPTIGSGPTHGTAAVEDDGRITYTPDAGFSGTDSYTYEVCDTSTPTPVCATATVTVTVNNVFDELDPSESTPHNTPVTTELADIVSVTGAALDPTTVTEDSAPEHGTLAIDPATGAVTYTPDTGYAGPDVYVVRVCDTSIPEPQCSTATVKVTVQPNVVTAVDDTASSDATVPVTTDVRDNDTTESGQPLALPTVTVDPGHGAAVVDADGTITYTPPAAWSGTDAYTYEVCDTSHPEPVCDAATVSVEVANVFTDGPAAEGNDGVETPQNTSVTTPLSDIVTTSGAPADPAAVTQLTAPSHGSISIDPGSGAVTFTPGPGYAGPDAYTVSVCDTSTPDPQCHQVTVAVTVLANTVSAPDLTVETRADTPSEPIDVLAESVSASGQELTPPTLTDEPAHGEVILAPDGTLVYVPGDGYDGGDSFIYQVCDTSHPTPACDTGTVTVTVTPVADLGVTKALASEQLVAGTPVSYEVAVTNHGPSTAQEVRTVDPVPAAVTDPVGVPDAAVDGGKCLTRPTEPADLERLDPAAGPYSLRSHPSTVECTYPALAAGTTAQATVSGDVDGGLAEGTEVVNQAIASATTYDPDPADNRAAATGTSAASADVMLTVATSDRNVDPGDEVEVTFTVENRGPSNSTGVVVDSTSTGLEQTGAEVSDRAREPARAADSWAVGDLAAGKSLVRTVTYRITGEDARVVGRAAAAAPGDPDLENNGGDACTSQTEGCGVVEFEVTAASDGNDDGDGNDGNDDGNDGSDNGSDNGSDYGAGDDDQNVAGSADGAGLPATGNPLGMGALALAVTLILAGAGALLVSRRRRSEG